MFSFGENEEILKVWATFTIKILRFWNKQIKSTLESGRALKKNEQEC